MEPSEAGKNLLQVPGQQANGTSKPTLNRPKATPAQVQPDGGWGWVVCLTSMIANGTVFGIINTFGILYVAILDHYGSGLKHDDFKSGNSSSGESNVSVSTGKDNMSFKTAWVGSVTTGVTFLMCMLSSIISDRLGIRKTGVVGGILALIGILSSAFVEELMLMYLTYGIFMGLGFAFAYAPSLVILGHYFKRHMGLVNGLVTFGSSAVTVVLALSLPHVLTAIGLRNTLLVLSGLVAMLIPCALTWKPVFTHENVNPAQAGMSAMSMEVIQSRCTDCYRFTRKYLNVRIWRNKGYVVWALSNGLCLFGYFVPFVHLVKYVEDEFEGSDGNILVMCIAVTSGVSRIALGKVADLPWIRRILMQQMAFVIMGICTCCIPLSSSFGGLIAITLIMGLCDGAFICLLGPIAFDLVGETGASQALGFLFGIFSIPMTVGPPVAGLLYDHMGSYNLAFYLAGAPPILGALIMFLIPKNVVQRPAVTTIEEFAAVSCHDIYHSRLEVESSVEAPPVSQVKPQVITLNDMNDLTLLVKSNQKPFEDVIEEENEKDEEQGIKTIDAYNNNDGNEEDADPAVPLTTDLDTTVNV